MVAAAFIGPGTLTTCIRAGIENGYSILWAVLFSTIATIVLQEMSARIGIVTQLGLGENIKARMHSPITNIISTLLVIVAILVGNSAFETGNITGTVMGMKILFPVINHKIFIVGIGVIVTVLLFTGSYEVIERVLTYIVFVMVLVFVTTAVTVTPKWQKILSGIFVPKFEDSNFMTVAGLFGTTIGPYSMFLHASAAAKKWHSQDEIRTARIDTIISIGLGGLITMCIVIVSAAFIGQEDVSINNAAELAIAIEPIWGKWSKWLIGIGLFTAGFSSAITAPLGAAYATTGILGKKSDIYDSFFKVIISIVITVGVTLSIIFGKSPTQIILLAQVSNAIILPLIAFFVILCANSKVMGVKKNGLIFNIASIFIVLICLIICYRNVGGFLKAIIELLLWS